MKDIPARAEARKKRKVAKRLLDEAERIYGTHENHTPEISHQIDSRLDRARALHWLAEDLDKEARLEDLTVRQNPLIKTIKNGEKRIYYRWIASWREGKKVRVVYLGSINKMSKDLALEKAKQLKNQYRPLNTIAAFSSHRPQSPHFHIIG